MAKLNPVYLNGVQPAFPKFESSIDWKEPTKDEYSASYRFQTLEEVKTTNRSKTAVNRPKTVI